MAEDCCKLVGNFGDTGFGLTSECIISVNSTVNTELTDNGCGGLSEGARVGSLNISGYASDKVYLGCPGRAGVQVLWLRKFFCAEDGAVVFIFLGAGRSFMFGGSNFQGISLSTESNARTKTLTASSQSGPSALYTDAEQTEGLGMVYTGSPISFSTTSKGGCTLADIGLGAVAYYLQNFNIEFVPGSIPVANYTFSYNP